MNNERCQILLVRYAASTRNVDRRDPNRIFTPNIPSHEFGERSDHTGETSRCESDDLHVGVRMTVVGVIVRVVHWCC